MTRTQHETMTPITAMQQLLHALRDAPFRACFLQDPNRALRQVAMANGAIPAAHLQLLASLSAQELATLGGSGRQPATPGRNILDWAGGLGIL
jgi:hypothetical protein